jgi:hypothetical protein
LRNLLKDVEKLRRPSKMAWAIFGGVVLLVSGAGTLTSFGSDVAHWFSGGSGSKSPVYINVSVGTPTTTAPETPSRPKSRPKLARSTQDANIGIDDAKVLGKITLKNAFAHRQCAPTYGFLIPGRPIAQIRLPPTDLPSDNWANYVAGYSALDAGEEQVNVRIQGAVNTSVDLHDIRVEIVRRQRRPSGTIVGLFNGGCGAVPVLGFDVNLDRPPFTLYDLNSSQNKSTSSFDYEIGTGQFVKIYVVANLRDPTEVVDWRLKMDVTTEGSTQTLTIDNQGLPFRLAGIGLHDPVYVVDEQPRRWREVQP